MSSTSCGIDFGTTNSAVSVARTNSVPELVPLEGENVIMPTALFFEFEDKTWKTSYGTAAIEDYLNGKEGRLMRSMKRVLGSYLMEYGTLLNGKIVKYDYVLKKYLANIKAKAEFFLSESVENVVIGRPVHFQNDEPDADPKAEDELRTTAKNIGYKNIEFQYEPIAAAFAFEENISDENLACVVDIGGGTSDISIIRLGKKLQNKVDRSDDILSNSGVRIGGDDFDKDLSISTFMKEFGLGTTYGEYNIFVPSYIYYRLSEWSSINNEYNYKNMDDVKQILLQSNDKIRYGRLYELLQEQSAHALLAIVEKAKIDLSAKDVSISKLNFMKNPLIIQASRVGFEKAIMKDVRAISQSVNECLALAQLRPENIKILILTGGSTEIPYIQNIIKSLFPNVTILSKNKLSSVALGLSYDAQRKFG